MFRRFLIISLKILLSIDQMLWTLIGSLLYGLKLMKNPPNPDEAISSVVGRKKLEGYKWAKVCAFIIDTIFYIFTKKWNHCIDHIENEELDGK